MFATECCLAAKKMTPEEARDWMVASEAEDSNNAISQLRSCAGLCNAGEFVAATNHLPLPLRKIAGDATDQRDDRLDHRGRPFSGIPDDQQYSDAVDVVGFKSIPQLFSCLLLNGFSLY